MSCDWRKDEKAFYLPPAKPVEVKIPAMGFFTIAGQGDPNGQDFSQAVEALYALSYAIKMSPKSKTLALHPGYHAYRVYPLEGVWDLNENGRAAQAVQAVQAVQLAEAQRPAHHPVNKADLVYKVMIRQPDFVDTAYAEAVRQAVQARKPALAALLERVAFVSDTEGNCVQLLHHGSFDSEPASFDRMQAFCDEAGWRRAALQHREIYLSDPRRAAPDALRTVLRFQVVRRS